MYNFFHLNKQPLRRVLSKKGLQHLIPENLENCLSISVQNYLKKVKAQVCKPFLICKLLI